MAAVTFTPPVFIVFINVHSISDWTRKRQVPCLNINKMKLYCQSKNPGFIWRFFVPSLWKLGAGEWSVRPRHQLDVEKSVGLEIVSVSSFWKTRAFQYGWRRNTFSIREIYYCLYYVKSISILPWYILLYYTIIYDT